MSVDDRVVSMDLRITEYNFKSLSPEQVKTLVADVQARPQNERVIDLDRVLAYVSDSPLQVENVEGIKADPPKIFWAPAPAILVNLDGEPIWSPIEGLDLRYALNTNWDLFEHTPSKTFYLRDNESWLQATAVTGPWTPVKDKLPASFSKLPADENWKDVKAAVPGKKLSGKAVPKVFVSTEPAELIVLEGAASYLKVEGAPTLLWVNNTEADLFRMGPDRRLLLPGRRPLVQGRDARRSVDVRHAVPAGRLQADPGGASALARAGVGARARRRRPKRCCSRRFPEPRASTRKS